MVGRPVVGPRRVGLGPRSGAGSAAAGPGAVGCAVRQSRTRTIGTNTAGVSAAILHFPTSGFGCAVHAPLPEFAGSGAPGGRNPLQRADARERWTASLRARSSGGTRVAADSQGSEATGRREQRRGGPSAFCSRAWAAGRSVSASTH